MAREQAPTDAAARAQGPSARAEAEGLSLTEAVESYLGTLPQEQLLDAQGELMRFARWYGADRATHDIRGHDLVLYSDSIVGANAPDAERRLRALRSFFAHAKKRGWTMANLATHVRLRKPGADQRPTGAGLAPEARLTAAGYAALRQELEALVAQRPQVAAEIQRSMADKDFRENAPLDAIREHQGHLEARIRELQTVLNQAVVVAPSTGAVPEAKVHLGTSVTLRNLASGAVAHYTIVDPTEVNTAQGKISAQSPVGKAMLECTVGDEVQVAAPAGTIRFRIEAVEG